MLIFYFGRVLRLQPYQKLKTFYSKNPKKKVANELYNKKFMLSASRGMEVFNRYKDN